MKSNIKRIAALLPLTILGLLNMGIAPTPHGAQAASAATPANFADPAFQTLWTRTDQLVDNGSVKRSYMWGPIPGFTAYEEYAEAAHGRHLVQYFDKSRMEINNPNGDKTDPFYVTNGLLTEELIYGRIQVGNNKFEEKYPAEINLASDTDDTSPGAPTYASFRYLAGKSINPRNNETIADTIARDGTPGTDPTLTSYNIRYTFFEPATNHNIPDIFWTFLNQSGPVIKDGKTITTRLNDPYFDATGYPIAEAYWARAKIAGVPNTAVLIQPYQRRVLTYVPDAPDAPEGFKVQVGNIGQHYYAWRYSGAGNPATNPPFPTVTPYATTTPTPPQCTTLPKRGFGKVWGDNYNVKVSLGCSAGGEQSMTVIQQYFQHGQMLETIQSNGQPDRLGGLIYVLFDDGTLKQFSDDYVDGTSEPNITAPSGLYVPVRGLGKIWREQTAANLRERLGWATAPETAAVSELHPIPSAPNPAPGQGGAIQSFQKGHMVYAGPVLRKIYVLFGLYSFPVDHWLVYDDTYSEP